MEKVCVGWHCITTDELSVIAEKIPPHTEENMHFHHKTIFIFFLGEAIMQFKNEAVQLKMGTGIKIDPMEAHQMRNVSDGEMNFIVVFTPKIT